MYNQKIFNTISTIKVDEIELCAHTLTDAFKNSPINNYIFSDQEQIFQFYVVMLRYCIDYGLAIRTSNFEAIALRILPGDNFNSYWRFLRTGVIWFFLKLPLRSKLHFLQITFVLSHQRKKIIGSRKHWYCWILGTQSAFQGKGFGSQLMQYTFSLALADNMDLYLQTDNDQAKFCHQKNGYVIEDELTLNQLKLYFMVKKIGKQTVD